VLRGDFDELSDIDVLVTFDEGVSYGIGSQLRLEAELAALFGRKVDYVERRLIRQSRNPIRRRAILESARLIYAAA